MAVGISDPLPPENKDVESKYTRLHITPLNPTLLPSILPPAVLSAARNISYHSLQTFPEKEFGFLDLPSMEAQKIRKKLNGSILKGTKVKIEEARPSKQNAGDKEGALQTAEGIINQTEAFSKKRKRDAETLPGVELLDRKVRRGWTEPIHMKKSDKKSKGKKDMVKSKYTSDPELLFRTTLPANKATSTEDALGLGAERKKKRKQSKEVIVHEFTKTMKHASFLRSSAVVSTAKGVAEYVEGKGWVDASGNIVEAPMEKSKGAKSRKPQTPPSVSESSVSSEVEEDSEIDNDMEEVVEKLTRVARQLSAEASSTSSSGSSSDEEDVVDGTVSSSSKLRLKPARNMSSLVAGKLNDTEPLPSPRTPVSLKLEIPKVESPIKVETIGGVHPLEALFKRRRPNIEGPKIPEAVPSFSFFDADDENDEGNDVVDSIPMTPYTKQDFALRGLRSAAPTPDTAFPSKSYMVWPTDNVSKDDAGDFDGDATPKQKQKAKQVTSKEDSTAAPVSDFQKWFYEHRGDNNRAWKRRRKVAAKEKRHRENKKRNERNV